MKHLLDAFSRLFPPLAPFVQAIQRDFEEFDAEAERAQAQAQARHDLLREEARRRREDLLNDWE